MRNLKPFIFYAGLNPFKWKLRYARWKKFAMVDAVIISPSFLSHVIKNGLDKEA